MLCHDFPKKNCSLKVSKYSVGEPFCVPPKFWYRKKLWMRAREGLREGGREGLSRFSLRRFCLTVSKNFVEDSFRVRQKFWYRKMLGMRGGASITIFRQSALSLSIESSRRGLLLCFKKFRVSNKILSKRGKSRFSTEHLLSHCTEKLRWGTH